MTGSASRWRGGAVWLTAGALAAAGVVVVLPMATAANPCANEVTRLTQDSQQKFAGGSLHRRFTATVEHPGGGGWRDQRAKVLVNEYPANADPRVISAKLGGREGIGAMAKAQEPQALAAINGDFFPYYTIRGVRDIRLPAGIVIKDGQVVRARREKMRFVGVDVRGEPAVGSVGVRGSVTIGARLPVDLAAVNWQNVRNRGVTVFTRDWKSTTPRPKGNVEIVIDEQNRVLQVRSRTQDRRQLGAPVVPGTRVLAYGKKAAAMGAAAAVGATVTVKIKQASSSGVRIQEGVGRGLPLVEGGVAAPLGCDAYSQHGNDSARPRTVVGWTAKGAWRTLTVPGTHFSGDGLRSGGFGLANLAAIAKRVGLAYAYELDGGGSTTLYTRNSKGKFIRRDLYGLDKSTGTYERESANGFTFLTP